MEAGMVTHVGRIAGRGTISVLHVSGIRSTYEPVEPTVVTGSAVGSGSVLGRLEEAGSHCGPAACLHLGAVRGDLYLDPLTLLQGGQRVRLLPLRPLPLPLPLGQAPEGYGQGLQPPRSRVCWTITGARLPGPGHVRCW